MSWYFKDGKRHSDETGEAESQSSDISGHCMYELLTTVTRFDVV